MRKCYVFDLDGTLCDITHRLHFIKPPENYNEDEKAKFKPDWRAFFAACVDDKPIPHMLMLYETIVCCHNVKDAVIVSGRSDEVRIQTVNWLVDHSSFIDGLRMETLYMRKAGDHRPDYKVKEEILELMRKDGWEPIMVFDDRKQVVDMWRKNGIPCLQVADGDF